MQHFIGALDGKHIDKNEIKDALTMFYNYKSRNNIVLLALCDANYTFIWL